MSVRARSAAACLGASLCCAVVSVAWPLPAQPLEPSPAPAVPAAALAPQEPATPAAASPASAEQTGKVASEPLTPAPSSAVPETNALPAGIAPPADPRAEKTKKKNKKSKGGALLGAGGELAVKGRVVLRSRLQRRESEIVNASGVPVAAHVDSLDVWLPDARFALRYQAPQPWLSAEIEADFGGGRPSLRDGYVQARGKALSVRAGQFKMPVSAVDMESSWTLPTVGRGFVHELLTDWLDVGGRRPGVLVGYRAKGGVRPRLSLGAFQGSVLEDLDAQGRDTALLSEVELAAQSLVARAQLEVANGLEVGAFYEHRIGSPAIGATDQYATAGLDITLDHVLTNGGVRFWVDGVVGESFYEHRDKPPGDDPLFFAGRALLGVRWGGTVEDAFYVEPFALAGVLDPDLDVTADFAWEVAAGVNVGLWKRARLTLQGEAKRASRNFPTAFFLGQDPDRFALLLQAGVAF
ncbi:MAG TPA: hypothetical protein VER33_13285, partial [Polyangiaceae bacterium]|nr:hypothetical protein [Polyangiaceae bacterium]